MTLKERITLFLKISLPLLVLVLWNVSPKNHSVEELLLESRAARRSGQHQSAARSMRLVLEQEPWRTYLWEQIGREEQQAGRFEPAAQAMHAALASGSLSLEGAFLLGEVYLQQKDYQAARAQWENLLIEQSLAPEMKIRIFDRLLHMHREQNEFQAVIETLQAWIALEPDNAQVTFLLGLHLTIVDPEKALPYLLEASRLDGLYTPTVQTVRRGLNLASGVEDPAYGWLMIGRSLGSANYWDLAEAAFIQAVSAAPDYAEAWAFLGEARFQLGGTGKPELDKAAEHNPRSNVVRALQALYWRRHGDLNQALTYLEAVAQEEPQEPIWQVEIANTLAEKGDLMAALDHFQRAVDLAPQVSLYWQYLAHFSIQYEVNVRMVGLPAARQAVLLAPDDPAALDTMGWALVSLADFVTAERFLQRAVERDATYSPALLHLAQIYIQQQDMQRAYTYLKRAQKYAGEGQVSLIAARLLLQYYGEGG
jgi:tetratricopeptide (TPR) repeat protein